MDFRMPGFKLKLRLRHQPLSIIRAIVVPIGALVQLGSSEPNPSDDIVPGGVAREGQAANLSVAGLGAE